MPLCTCVCVFVCLCVSRCSSNDLHVFDFVTAAADAPKLTQ